MKFDGLDALKAQIAKDVLVARAFFHRNAIQPTI
jgi:FAD synthase